MFGGCNRTLRARIAIDPVVQVQPRVGNAALRRSGEETGVEHLAHVGYTVTLAVLQPENVASGGGDQSALPRHQAGNRENVIGEHGAAVDLAVPVCVFQHDNPRERRLPLRRVLGIIQHFGDEYAPVFIEDHLDRVIYHWLVRKEIDFEVRVNLDAFQRLFRRARRLVGVFLAATNQEN